MAQPHQYPGDWSPTPPEAGLSYEESFQANPFPGVATPWVPGQQQIVEDYSCPFHL